MPALRGFGPPPSPLSSSPPEWLSPHRPPRRHPSPWTTTRPCMPVRVASIDVLRNDSDPDGDELAICRVGPSTMTASTSTSRRTSSSSSRSTTAARTSSSPTTRATSRRLVAGDADHHLQRDPSPQDHQARPPRTAADDERQRPNGPLPLRDFKEERPDGRTRVFPNDSGSSGCTATRSTGSHSSPGAVACSASATSAGSSCRATRGSLTERRPPSPRLTSRGGPPSVDARRRHVRRHQAARRGRLAGV